MSPIRQNIQIEQQVERQSLDMYSSYSVEESSSSQTPEPNKFQIKIPKFNTSFEKQNSSVQLSEEQDVPNDKELFHQEKNQNCQISHTKSDDMNENKIKKAQDPKPIENLHQQHSQQNQSHNFGVKPGDQEINQISIGYLNPLDEFNSQNQSSDKSVQNLQKVKIEEEPFVVEKPPERQYSLLNFFKKKQPQPAIQIQDFTPASMKRQNRSTEFPINPDEVTKEGIEQILKQYFSTLPLQQNPPLKRKRRSLKQTSEAYKCFCGKYFVSYAGIFMHFRQKHQILSWKWIDFTTTLTRGKTVKIMNINLPHKQTLAYDQNKKKTIEDMNAIFKLASSLKKAENSSIELQLQDSPQKYNYQAEKPESLIKDQKEVVNLAAIQKKIDFVASQVEKIKQSVQEIKNETKETNKKLQRMENLLELVLQKFKQNSESPSEPGQIRLEISSRSFSQGKIKHDANYDDFVIFSQTLTQEKKIKFQ